MFSSCENKLSDVSINRYKKENDQWHADFSQMKGMKSNIKKDLSKADSTFKLTIDPKKIRDFNRNREIKQTLRDKQDSIFLLAETYDALLDTLIGEIQNNRTFINSEDLKRLTDEELQLKWVDRKSRVQILSSRLTTVLDEISDEKSQVYSIYRDLANQYGIKPKKVKK